jgi:hypothetical protein
MLSPTIVFLGPSLSVQEAKTILPEAAYHPPVQCGDIIRILSYQPKIIAIIDGYFEHRAAVWHKEILAALAQQIQVYGAASMGALRAAELAEFGMIGMGEIFNEYYSGALTDDDEVTVMHRPEKSHYEPITDAMVNIRATLKRALNKNLISLAIAECLSQHAKSQFYKQRSLLKTIDWYAKQYNKQDIEPLRDWLAQGNFVDQKRLDAITLLSSLKTCAAPPALACTVNNTILLQKLNDRCQCEPDDKDINASLENTASDMKRYARLIAYLIKTNDRWEKQIVARDIIALNNKIKNTYNLVSDNPDLYEVFYHFALLFDMPLLIQLDFSPAWQINSMKIDAAFAKKDEVAKHIKILLLASSLLIELNAKLINEEIKLNPVRIGIYKAEIIQLLQKKSTPETAEKYLATTKIDKLVNYYFILKDIINNSADLFFAPSQLLCSQPYYSIAEQLYINL